MTYSLDDLRQETRKKFAPFVLDMKDKSKVSMTALIRLPKDDRKAVQEALGVINEDLDPDDPESFERVFEAIAKVLNIVADKPAKLLKELDDPDQLVKMSMQTEVLAKWATGTQLGEAQNSPA